MKMDIKKYVKESKVGKIASKFLLVASLLATGAAINEFSDDVVNALEAKEPKAEVVHAEIALPMPIADEKAYTQEELAALFPEAKAENTLLVAKDNVQTVTSPTTQVAAISSKTIVTTKDRVALATKDTAVVTTTSMEKPVAPTTGKKEVAETKTEIKAETKISETATPVVAKEETKTETKTETTKPTSTTVSFTDVNGAKVHVPFEGNVNDFSGMFIFRDGAWVALSKKESLKVNPYQHLNWTRNDLILQAIEWEKQGAPKELAWNAYYEFEAKQAPHHYEVVNGYTRPNKRYFAELVSSSIRAAREANAKGDAFTTGEWQRNAQEHLNSYHAAPGKEVDYIFGLENGNVPNLVGSKTSVSQSSTTVATTQPIVAPKEVALETPKETKDNSDQVDTVSDVKKETPSLEEQSITSTPTLPINETPTTVDESNVEEENVAETIVSSTENTVEENTPATDVNPVIDEVVATPVPSTPLTEDANEGTSEDLVL